MRSTLAEIRVRLEDFVYPPDQYGYKKIGTMTLMEFLPGYYFMMEYPFLIVVILH